MARRWPAISPTRTFIVYGQAFATVPVETLTVSKRDAAPSDGQLVSSASRDNPLLNLATLYDMTPRARLGRAFHIYRKLVESYSQRSFSFKADILRGFAGMFAVLDEHLHSTTLHGLSAAVFSHTLLWTPAARLPRRGTELPTSLQSTLGDPDRQFPIWSWAGWDGAVEDRVFEKARGEGEFLLPPPLVKCFETVSSNGQTVVVDVAEYRPEPPRALPTPKGGGGCVWQRVAQLGFEKGNLFQGVL
ncbi:hypothetical protein B0T26DRAFT_755476 [Lasiosphaeria miniovina]|uniref:Uncharacterized protein n=1 Tax=Lasiosphaeria miniovina TaxID=1954250 RepID=A0AA40DM57_9PEZI|nr:uncharacterized protein B0T26DRAFT_755476 [Lasiosphaeria miniovina]KAK0705907.1 hypothetical protein B0T26DRAFT_755476 [Lasiosphaeria miniovina]